ncbi:hypothetical protein ACJMK2_029533 [Sinanodonta woodiana]|uniref:Uncharacterized protein n=1 Tax=Sinanodonta woodiana TaxID=1069815 RepID=A0ABD3XAX4_SINWO
MLSKLMNPTELSLLFLLFVSHWGWTSPLTTTKLNSPETGEVTTIPTTTINIYSNTSAPIIYATTLIPSSSMSMESTQITTSAITLSNATIATSTSLTSSPANCGYFNCSNRGSCFLNTSTNTAECTCNQWYSGTHCELGPCDANPGPCPPNVTCQVVNDAPYCQCRGDFKGLNCSEVDTLVTCKDNPIPIYLDLKKAGNTPIDIYCLPTQNTSSGDVCYNPGEGIVYTLRNESSFLQILQKGNNECLAVTNVSLVEHTSYTVTLIATEADDVQYRPSRNDKLDLELTFNKDPIINSSVFVFYVDGKDNPFNFTIQVVDPEMQNIWVDIIGIFPPEYKSIVKNSGASTQFQITKPTTTIPDNGLDITVQIKVNDSGIPPAATRGNVTLKLVSLVCSVSNSSIYIDTNADLSKPIATVSCIKKGHLTLVYSINQASNGIFKISGNDTSAQVFLTSNSVTRYQTTVYVDAAVDSANSSISVSVSMNVTVADLKPKCSPQNLTAVSFSENALLGLCSDVAYTCLNNLSSSMTCQVVNSTIFFNLSCVLINGALSVKVCTAQPLGGRVGNFTVNAVVENDYGRSGILSIPVMVTNVNEAPQIIAGINVLDVNEDVPLNSTILSVNVTDEDLPFGDTLTSSINSTDVSLPFRIVQREINIGSKTVVFNIQVVQALNASVQQAYNLTIRVEDKAGLFTTTFLTVKVNDVNQPPICPSSVSIRGNITSQTGTTLGTVQCDDVDIDPVFKSITYTIFTGEPQVVKDTLSVFSNGSIILIGNMRDIENISSFKIEAKDNGGLKTNVTVNIIINSNFPPRCFPSDVTVNISENVLANVCFPFPNPCVNPVDNDQLIFTNFTGNGSVSLFQKNASANQLVPCTKVALKGLIGLYVVNIEVHNSYGKTMLSFYVTVVDENDPPVFNTPKYVTSIDEEKPLGTTVLSVSASDPDTGALGIISYKSDGMPAFFNLNGTTGVISIAGVIDAENLTSLNVTFIVQAISGEFAVNATVTVIIIDINDKDPVCSNPNPDEVNIDLFDSPGKLIYRFSCSDKDVSPQYNTLVFSLVSSTPQSVFNISRNGEVRIANKLPLINGNYSLQVKVQDNDAYVWQSPRGLSTSLTVVVNTNYPPRCNPNFINQTVDETHPASCIGQEVICNDPANDPSKNSTMQVGKATGNATSFLEIKEKTTAVIGQIGLSMCLNSSIKGMISTYQLKTIISNVLGQTEVVWMLMIGDVNEAPYFSSQNYTAYAVEGYRNVTMEPLITLQAFDPDNSTPAFQLSNDSITATLLYPADPQAIVLKGNILYRAQTLNATRYNEYKFALTVTDKQGLTGNTTATVFVLDINEVPICPQTQMTVQTALDASAGVTLLHIFCYDTDREDAYRRLNYSVKPADPNFNGIFNVTSTGDLVLLSKFPRTLALGNTILQVQVSDEGTPPLSTIVAVNVTINREIPAKCNPTTIPPLSWVINSCLRLMMNCSDPTSTTTSHLLYTFQGNFSVGFNLTDSAPDGVFTFCYTLVGSMYDNTYLINVMVNNNLTVVTYPVTVPVVYQASTPLFSSQSYYADVGEDTKAQQTIMNVSASVRTGTVSYSIIDNSTLGSYFRINETTGVVTSTKDLMPISNQNLTLKVKALNPESLLTSTVTIFIRVIDINAAPVCNITQTEFNTSVTLAADTVLFNFVCSDMDTSPDNSHVSYSISGSNVDTFFQLQENISLTLRTKSLLSLTLSRYNITFTAQDSGTPPLKFQKMFVINVNLTPPAPLLTAVSNLPSTISVSWQYARAEFVNITNGFVLSVKGNAADTRYDFQPIVSSKEVTGLSADTLYNISVTAVTMYGNVTATKTVRTKAIPVLTSLTFTIRMTGMDFTVDLKNPSTVVYNTTRDRLVLALDMLLGSFQGYAGATLLSFRRGSVIADAKVSVDQTGNINTIQAALLQSVATGFIGLNGTTIAVDSTFFISYIGDGYSILNTIFNVTDSVGIHNGNAFTITCVATVVGNAQPVFTWKYNTNVMSPVNSSRISISDIIIDSDTPQIMYSSVSFRPIQSSDSGTYECVITDQFLRPKTMNISVYVLSQPVVSIQPLTQTVDAGSTVTITCKVENNVTLSQMVWIRNGININSTSKLPEETFSKTGTAYILTRRNITSATVYECYGENDAGPGEVRQSNISVVLLGSGQSATCNNETDSRGTKWSRTLQDTYDIKPCPIGMSGEAVRYCSAGGVWVDASYYNCINNALLDLQTQTDNIKNGLAPNTVPESLVKLTDVTNTSTVELQKAEVQVVSTVLDNVIQISSNTKNITNIDVENFLQIASNVIDEKNIPSWQALIDENKEGASVVLRNVEQYSRLKAQLINSTGEPVKRFTKKNLFVEIGHNPTNDIQFPTGSAFTNGSFSGYFLSRDILSNGNFTSYSGAYFHNVTEIIRKNVLSNGAITNRDDLGINSAVLSLQLDPPPSSLSPPLILTFKHFSSDFSNPVCSFWKFNADGQGNGSWLGEGCKLVSTSDYTTVCQCDHLTNFAILMSPGKTPSKDQLPLSIISTIGCAISIFCLSVTMIAHFIVWRYVKSDRTTLLMNLCLALIISYVIFLAGVDRTENKNACTAVAALLHYFYLAVFFLMLAYGIELAVTVVYVFETRSRVRWLLPLAWILPAVVVAISLGVTQLEGYGNDKFCWLSIDDGLIWAFVGPAAFVILLNFMIIILVFHRMFSSSAMLTKSDKVKAKSGARSLCVLLPITGITWVFGILSVNEDLVVFQYLFAIINSLQGLFISLFYCFFNRHIRESIKQINAARKRSQASYSATLKSSARSSGQIKFDSLDDSRKNNASDIVASSKNPFLQADRQMQKLVEKYAKDGQPIKDFAEYSNNIPNNRSSGDVSIEDVKISNILHESEIRKDLDHIEVAATSLLITTASSSIDKDTGESKIPRESHKYDYIDAARLDESQGEYQTALEPILSNNLRTSADGEKSKMFGQKPSQNHDKLVPKSGFDPFDSGFDKSRNDPDKTSSKERLSITHDKGIISSREKLSTSHEKLENVNLKRGSKDEVYETDQSGSGSKVKSSNSKSKSSKDSKDKRHSSKSRKYDEEYQHCQKIRSPFEYMTTIQPKSTIIRIQVQSTEAKRDSKYAKRKSAEPEQNRGRPSTRTSKAKDIASAKKRSRDRSQDYEYSAYDLAYMGPQVYHSSVENVAEYIAYNPYVGVHAYGGQQISPVDPWQYYQPHIEQPRKKYW